MISAKYSTKVSKETGGQRNQFPYKLLCDNFMARFIPKKYTWNKDHPNYEKPAWLNRNKAKN